MYLKFLLNCKGCLKPLITEDLKVTEAGRRVSNGSGKCVRKLPNKVSKREYI